MFVSRPGKHCPDAVITDCVQNLLKLYLKFSYQLAGMTFPTGTLAREIILFIIFVNSKDDREENILKNFSLNPSRKGMSTWEDKIKSQNYLQKWLEIKKMKFNRDKCRRTLVGKNQPSVFR